MNYGACQTYEFCQFRIALPENVVRANVEWGEKIIAPVTLNITESPQIFKQKLQYLLGVPTNKQTLIVNGFILKNDLTDWSSVDAVQPANLRGGSG